MGFNYTVVSPNVDETVLPGESAQQLVKRLAYAKAAVVAHGLTNSLVIGSDQVGCVAGEIMGKPLTPVRARQQLETLSAQECSFYTGLCLWDTRTQDTQQVVEPFKVKFRALSAVEIEHYLQLEKPYNCACSFKSEGAGAMLCEAFIGTDPNTLIGLPVMALFKMLTAVGYPVFDKA